MSQSIFNRKGISLIVVMLIILAITSIAIFSLKMTQNDTRQVNGFAFNRQASQGAHSAGYFVLSKSSDDSLKAATISFANAVDDVMQNQTSTANAEVSWYDASEVSPFTGMDKTIPSSTNNNRLHGDLAKPTSLVGTLGNLELINKTVAGFSDGDAFCSYTMHANAYALVGRAVPVRTTGSNQYYLLSDLNARVTGFKREMGLLDVTPLPCHQ